MNLELQVDVSSNDVIDEDSWSISTTFYHYKNLLKSVLTKRNKPFNNQENCLLLQRSVIWKLHPDGSKRFARAMSWWHQYTIISKRITNSCSAELKPLTICSLLTHITCRVELQRQQQLLDCSALNQWLTTNWLLRNYHTYLVVPVVVILVVAIGQQQVQ